MRRNMAHRHPTARYRAGLFFEGLVIFIAVWALIVVASGVDR